jgi:hypothetical protein
MTTGLKIPGALIPRRVFTQPGSAGDMPSFANLSRLIARERSARAQSPCEDEIVIWRDTDAQVAADIEAAKVAGRIGPRTTVTIVGWRQSAADEVASGADEVASALADRLIAKIGGRI